LTSAPINPTEGSIRFIDYGEYVAVQGTGYWSPAYLDAHFAELFAGYEAIAGGARVAA